MAIFQWVSIALLAGVTIEAWGARLNARKAIEAADRARLEVQLLREMLENRLDSIESRRDT